MEKLELDTELCNCGTVKQAIDAAIDRVVVRETKECAIWNAIVHAFEGHFHASIMSGNKEGMTVEEIMNDFHQLSLKALQDNHAYVTALLTEAMEKRKPVH